MGRFARLSQPARRAARARLARIAGYEQEVHVLQAVTLREIQAIFEISDRLGIHREMLVIPLAPRHPGRLRTLPNGKIEIVVDSEADFATWLAGLEAELRKLA